MQKTIILLAVLAASLVANTVRAADDKVDTDKIAGKWKYGTGDDLQSMTFNKDGTYSIVSHRAGGDPRTESGTWKMDGKSMTMKCEKCSYASMEGKEHKVNVTKATDDALTLIEGDDKTSEIELVRTRDDSSSIVSNGQSTMTGTGLQRVTAR